MPYLNHWETGKPDQQNGKMERKNKEYLNVALGGGFSGFCCCCCYIVYLHVLYGFTILVLQLSFYFEEVSVQGSRICVNVLLMIKMKELGKLHYTLDQKVYENNIPMLAFSEEQHSQTIKYIFYNNTDYGTNSGNLRTSGDLDTKQSVLIRVHKTFQ